VFPNPAPGGNLALVVVAGVVGLGWGWIVRRTGSLRWSTVAHIAFDFSGLGARLYF
jgi:membrane protease YdiL (CAAX protease family)